MLAFTGKNKLGHNFVVKKCNSIRNRWYRVRNWINILIGELYVDVRTSLFGNQTVWRIHMRGDVDDLLNYSELISRSNPSWPAIRANDLNKQLLSLLWLCELLLVPEVELKQWSEKNYCALDVFMGWTRYSHVPVGNISRVSMRRIRDGVGRSNRSGGGEDRQCS